MVHRINVQFSPFHKTLKFNIGKKEYDISSEIPEDIWNIGDRKFPLHPLKDWQMRIEVRRIFIKWFKENIDPNMDEDDVVF